VSRLNLTLAFRPYWHAILALPDEPCTVLCQKVMCRLGLMRFSRASGLPARMYHIPGRYTPASRVQWCVCLCLCHHSHGCCLSLKLPHRLHGKPGAHLSRALHKESPAASLPFPSGSALHSPCLLLAIPRARGSGNQGTARREPCCAPSSAMPFISLLCPAPCCCPQGQIGRRLAGGGARRDERGRRPLLGLKRRPLRRPPGPLRSSALDWLRRGSWGAQTPTSSCAGPQGRPPRGTGTRRGRGRDKWTYGIRPDSSECELPETPTSSCAGPRGAQARGEGEGGQLSGRNLDKNMSFRCLCSAGSSRSRSRSRCSPWAWQQPCSAQASRSTSCCTPATTRSCRASWRRRPRSQR